jgi:hypothetical protein
VQADPCEVVVDEWELYRFFSEYFHFPLSVPFHTHLHLFRGTSERSLGVVKVCPCRCQEHWKETGSPLLFFKSVG